jgi:formate dehydrogenase major subunit
MDREIQRILDLGVDLNLNCAAGRDVTMDELRKRHQVLFLGIGAHKGKAMRIPGEEGPGVWTGTEYLRRVNSHERVDVGNAVAVIGGGDTAVDAARVARRTGAQVTIVYRRTRTEMPAIAPEIEAALKEGVRLELLLAPVEVKRDASGGVVALRVQKMELGEPDESGRRRPVPVKGSEYDIPVDTVIAAISQEPDWAPLNDVKPKSGWVEVDAHGKWTDGVYSGGDVLDLGIATTAVAHGRRAAEAAHAQLRGLEPPRKSELPAISRDRLKPEIYEAKARSERAHRPVEEWLTRPDDEIDLGLTREQFLFEAGRCFSCGQCSACERCWMYCTPNCFSKLPEPRPGAYFSVRLDICDGCKKCAEQCPCGFLDMV